MRHVLAIAYTEWRLGVRNRWVLLATALLLLFALVLGLLGSAPAGDVDTDRLSMTVASLATLSVYLVPLLALLVSFDAIAGEIERGTLPILLATACSRSAVILGKFSGQVLVVGLAIVLGYGLAGACIIWLGDTGLGSLPSLLRLMATSVSLGAAFVAVSLIASTLFRQTGTAAAVAIGVWLLSVVLYDLGLLALLLHDSEGRYARDIFPWLLLANPADAFRLYNLSELGLQQAGGGVASAVLTLPFPPVYALLSLATWTVAALSLSIFIFRRIEP